jgi:hypothetical protein
MAEKPGPETLRALAAGLHVPVALAEIDALAAHADAWEAERAGRDALAEQLAEAQKRLELLEQERKWWLENAIKRHKRAEARRSGRTPRSRART